MKSSSILSFRPGGLPPEVILLAGGGVLATGKRELKRESDKKPGKTRKRLRHDVTLREDEDRARGFQVLDILGDSRDDGIWPSCSGFPVDIL